MIKLLEKLEKSKLVFTSQITLSRHKNISVPCYSLRHFSDQECFELIKDNLTEMNPIREKNMRGLKSSLKTRDRAPFFEIIDGNPLRALLVAWMIPGRKHYN